MHNIQSSLLGKLISYIASPKQTTIDWTEPLDGNMGLVSLLGNKKSSSFMLLQLSVVKQCRKPLKLLVQLLDKKILEDNSRQKVLSDCPQTAGSHKQPWQA